MWVPVLESDGLKSDRPVRLSYWGTPVVVFRTSSGRLGAIEDACGHRGVPLSQGCIRGEQIQCGFHHFRFDINGRCTHIPAVFGADEGFRRRCNVRKFFIREEVGLIWISVEDEPEAEFPVDASLLPDDRITATGSFNVDGDLRVWLDHFLDIPHCIWAHAESAYFGSPERPAELASVRVGIGNASRYPVRRAIEMAFCIEDDGRYARYAVPVRMLAVMDRIKKRLHRNLRAGCTSHLKVRADLVTPLCQETRSRVGPLKVCAWTGINPLSAGKNQFIYSLVADARNRGWISRIFGRKLLHDFVRYHLGVEDGNFLAYARYFDDERLCATDLDSTVLAMREMFTTYQREKGKLYPDDSLIHAIRY
ncbi:Rieske (2Fe-2S) protein [Mycobacterium decipiens]|uniref:Rieske (2Fe-2S) protein n=1 Tax=Mycobacterium decipiens TaxID=1430326 RepID=UPI0013FD7BF3|nr:Rieske (2Fe-2S) protein [Mycobacterium decipiens]